jgi:RNA polymerase sigma-70 factor (ECF subfamily)
VTEPLLGEFADATVCDDVDFEAFFIDWHPTVRRWAQQHYGASYADEIAQETLSRAFVHFRELRHAVPWPWLVTVARNVACDLHRNAARCTDAGPAVLERPDPGPGPEDVAIRTETSKSLRQAVLALPPSQRELLAMAVERGMSIAAMAEELGTTQGAIRVRLHRARKSLGCLYAKSGNLAVAPVAGLGWLWRQLRRGIQPATQTMAPATAMMMATAVVTVGVVAAGSAPVRIGAGHAQSVALSTHHASGAAAAAGHRHDEALRSRAVNTQGNGAHVAPSAPVTSGPTTVVDRGPLNAHADLAKDPIKAGTAHDHDIVVHTPAGDVRVKGGGVQGEDSSLVCYDLGVTCR